MKNGLENGMEDGNFCGVREDPKSPKPTVIPQPSRSVRGKKTTKTTKADKERLELLDRLAQLEERVKGLEYEVSHIRLLGRRRYF